MSARQCIDSLEWTECMSTCGSTCESLSADTAGTCSQIEAADCLPGCQCPAGTVFDQRVGAEGSCVAPAECSCHHKGTAYAAQTTVTVDCNEWSVYWK